ncbi:GTP--adenosylcobinamide-phosphate guanylyltransferase [Candidatus Bathyarchaeota archaeon]|nr:MAG: GTP--adenosylcobinamide-phosphate guanylyltransferase [Candidatus Bathyarchaeota archaeon]
MGITALVMAGGRGTRMGLDGEKPLLKVGGKPMIEHVITALMNSRRISDIIVAVSKYTPQTAEFMERFPVKVLKTPGRGYIPDMKYAIKRLKLKKVLIISADLPLVTGRIIDRIIEKYDECGKPALTVAVPLEMRKKLGLKGKYAFEVESIRVVPAGINLIDGRRIDEEEIDEEVLILKDDRVAVNVNTPLDLSVAERLLSERLREINSAAGVKSSLKTFRNI